MRDDSQKHLLFALLACQNELITKAQLTAAFSVWLGNRSKGLDQILVEQSALNEEQRSVLDSLVNLHLAKHGDLAKSMSQLSSMDGVVQELQSMVSPELAATLPPEFSEFATALHLSKAETNASPTKLATGEDRFRIIRHHANGGLGVVHVAEDQQLRREVALKQIRDDCADSDAYRAKFIQEAEVTGQLEHPGIVPVYGLGTDANGRPYYAMRFIKGEELKVRIQQFHEDRKKKKQPFDCPELRSILRRFTDVCNAIDYAHDRGVLHRDLKPGNVMLGKHGETLVVDWGLAKPMKQPAEADPWSTVGPDQELPVKPSDSDDNSATAYGSFLGTPAYAPPEQISGELDNICQQSDVYSLGAILYEILTGRPPVEKAGSRLELLSLHNEGKIPSPRSLDPNIPKPLNAICQKAISLKITDRYATATELKEEVERWLDDQPVQSFSESLLLRARRWIRKHPRSVAALATLLLAGIASVASVTAVVGRKNQQLAGAFADLLIANDSQKRATDAESRAKSMAEVKQKEAEAARNDLAATSEVAKHTLYARTVSLAHQEWQAGNLNRATGLLHSTDASLRGWEWSYLQRLLFSDALTLLGMEGYAESVVLSADGEFIVAVGSIVTMKPDPHVYVWRRSNGMAVAKYEGPAVISPDGTQLALLGKKNTSLIRIIDPRTGKELASMHGSKEGSWYGAFNRTGKYFAAVGLRGLIRVWEVGKEEPIADIEQENLKNLPRIALSDQGDKIAWLRRDTGTLEWRDLSKPEVPIHVVPYGNQRLAIDVTLTHGVVPVFSPDGKSLAIPKDRQIVSYDTTTGEIKETKIGHSGSVTSIDFSPDGSRLVSSSVDSTIRVWQAKGGELLKLRGHYAGFVYGVYSVHFDTTGNWIVSGGADSTVRLWDAWAGDVKHEEVDSQTGSNPRWLRSPLSQQADWLGGDSTGQYTIDIETSHDGRYVASCGSDKQLRMIETKEGVVDPNAKAKIFQHSPPRSLSAIAFSKDGTKIATGSGSIHDNEATAPGEVCVWDIASEKLLNRFSKLSGPVSGLAFHDEGDRLTIAVGLYRAPVGELLQWDFSSDNALWRAAGQHAAVGDMAIDPNGKWIVTVHRDGKNHFWDAETGKQLRSFGTTGQVYDSVAVSPNGQHLVVGTVDWSLRLLDVAGGREIWSRRNHSGGISDVQFSRDGRRIFSASVDGTCRVWDSKYGDETLVLSEGGGFNFALGLAADESLLVARQESEIAIYRPEATYKGKERDSENWPIAFSDDFNDEELRACWNQTKGEWNIDGGALVGKLTHAESDTPFTSCALKLQFPTPSFADISFDIYSADPLVVGAELQDVRKKEGIAGLLMGSNGVSLNHPEKGAMVFHQSHGKWRPGSSRSQEFAFTPNEKVRLRCTRLGDRWEVWFNGTLMLVDRLTSELSLPDIYLAATYGRPDSSLHIDNFVVRVPESAKSEQRALQAVTDAFEKFQVTSLAMTALNNRDDLNESERKLATQFAEYRQASPEDDVKRLLNLRLNDWIDPEAAPSIIEWLEEQVPKKTRFYQLNRGVSNIHFCAGEFEKAIEANQVVKERSRSNAGHSGPQDVAKEAICFLKLGDEGTAKKLAADLHETLRSTTWTHDTNAKYWIDEIRKAQLMPDENSETARILGWIWDLQRALHEESDPEPFIAALSDDARFISGRTEEPDQYDIVLDKSTYSASERLWRRAKALPLSVLIREGAKVTFLNDRIQVETKSVWIHPNGEGYRGFVERFELVRFADRWQIKSARQWTNRTRIGDARWSDSVDGWKKLEKPFESAPVDDHKRRSSILHTANRYREAFQEALTWTKEMPASDEAHRWLAKCAYQIGDVATMESAARKAIELKPWQGHFLRAIETEMNLMESTLNVLGKSLRIPKSFSAVSLQGRPTVGVVLAAWKRGPDRYLYVEELAKSERDQSVDTLFEVLEQQVKKMNGSVVRHGTKTIGGRTVFSGLFLGPDRSPSDSGQAVLAIEDGERFVLLNIRGPISDLANLTNELHAVLEIHLNTNDFTQPTSNPILDEPANPFSSTIPR